MCSCSKRQASKHPFIIVGILILQRSNGPKSVWDISMHYMAHSALWTFQTFHGEDNALKIVNVSQKCLEWPLFEKMNYLVYQKAISTKFCWFRDSNDESYGVFLQIRDRWHVYGQKKETHVKLKHYIIQTYNYNSECFKYHHRNSTCVYFFRQYITINGQLW